MKGPVVSPSILTHLEARILPRIPTHFFCLARLKGPPLRSPRSRSFYSSVDGRPLLAGAVLPAGPSHLFSSGSRSFRSAWAFFSYRPMDFPNPGNKSTYSRPLRQEARNPPLKASTCFLAASGNCPFSSSHFPRTRFDPCKILFSRPFLAGFYSAL